MTLQNKALLTYAEQRRERLHDVICDYLNEEDAAFDLFTADLKDVLYGEMSRVEAEYARMKKFLEVYTPMSYWGYQPNNNTEA